MYDDLQNDNNLVDNSNFDTDYYEEEDFIEQYEQMMADLDDQDPMDILPEMDPDVDFYEALDGWGNYYYEEDQLTDRLAKKGKNSHKKFKEDENEFKKEFSDELAMLYDLLDEANKFNKKLVKKYVYIIILTGYKKIRLNSNNFIYIIFYASLRFLLDTTIYYTYFIYCKIN